MVKRITWLLICSILPSCQTVDVDVSSSVVDTEDPVCERPSTEEDKLTTVAMFVTSPTARPSLPRHRNIEHHMHP